MKLLLVGDVCPTERTSSLFKEKNTDALFNDVASIFKEKDLVFANLECVLTDSDRSIDKFGPALKAPRETAEVLRELGVTLCGLSNNHIFDFGRRGIGDTLDALSEAGIATTGFGSDYNDSRKNYIFEKNGEKICIIAVCEHEYSYALEDRMGSRPYDEYDTLEDVRNAKAQADKVIVIYHGGKEYCRYPSPRLHKLCHAMARAGADAVLCQHSHCIGSYEKYEGCHILYGQGNFHFIWDSDFDGWYTSVAVEYDTERNEISFVPIYADKCGIYLAKGEKGDALLREFEERNQTLSDGSWKNGWKAFCEANKDFYIGVIRNACVDASTDPMFAHYLDCEAHTDIWRELFPTYNLTNERDKNN